MGCPPARFPPAQCVRFLCRRACCINACVIVACCIIVFIVACVVACVIACVLACVIQHRHRVLYDITEPSVQWMASLVELCVLPSCPDYSVFQSPTSLISLSRPVCPTSSLVLSPGVWSLLYLSVAHCVRVLWLHVACCIIACVIQHYNRVRTLPCRRQADSRGDQRKGGIGGSGAHIGWMPPGRGVYGGQVPTRTVTRARFG